MRQAILWRGSKGEEVLELQRLLGVTADGDFGPVTETAVRSFQGSHNLKVDGVAGPQTWKALRQIDPGPPPVENPIKVVGAWCGSSSLALPERDVDFSVRCGINRLDVIVNDHSRFRKATNFTLRDRKKIEKLCELARNAGIEVHLMSWIMPHRKYLEQAAMALVPLCADVGAGSLQWDAEEPWMKAYKPMDYNDAGRLVGDLFKDLPCPMGVNGIGYASKQKLRPLTNLSTYVVPQCYSTRSTAEKWKLTPEKTVPKLYGRWLRMFPNAKFVIGLAAYRQSGIPGHTPTSAMEMALNRVREIGSVDTVLYWSLYAIRQNKAVAKVISGIRG